MNLKVANTVKSKYNLWTIFSDIQNQPNTDLLFDVIVSSLNNVMRFQMKYVLV